MLKGLLYVCVLILISGCTVHKRLPSTGFLERYDQLKPMPSHKVHFFAKQRDANLSSFTKLLIPDIQVVTLPQDMSAYDRELYTQISAYATAGYRKMIDKYSKNYTLVDVAQKNALLMQIALSAVSLDASDIYSAEVMPFSLDVNTRSVYSGSKVYLLVEVNTKDAFSGETLARSLQVVTDVPVTAMGKELRISDLQPAIDTWLGGIVR